MPGADGYEVCRQVKRSRPGTPVLLLVGTFETFDEAQAQSCGSNGHLKKPFDSQELYPPGRTADRRKRRPPDAGSSGLRARPRRPTRSRRPVRRAGRPRSRRRPSPRPRRASLAPFAPPAPAPVAAPCLRGAPFEAFAAPAYDAPAFAAPAAPAFEAPASTPRRPLAPALRAGSGLRSAAFTAGSARPAPVHEPARAARLRPRPAAAPAAGGAQRRVPSFGCRRRPHRPPGGRADRRAGGQGDRLGGGSRPRRGGDQGTDPRAREPGPIRRLPGG